jgi:hypothetical protein
MRNADRIEAINSEQLATATDRLLLRASRQRSGRGSRLADGSQARIVIARRAEGSRPHIVISGEVAHAAPAPAPRAQGSQPRIVIAPSLAHPAPPKRASLPAMYALPERARSSQRFALMLLVPTMACIAAGITALL